MNMTIYRCDWKELIIVKKKYEFESIHLRCDTIQ